MIIRSKPEKHTLTHIYTTINKIIKKEECYYTFEELKSLKEDKNNIFLKKEGIE